MSVRVHVSPHLLPDRAARTWEIEARSVLECVAAIEARSPGLGARLSDEMERLRQGVRVLVNGAEVSSLRAPLVGDEVVVFETADSMARARVHALARLGRRARLDEEYERAYGPLVAESGCASELGEGVLFAFMGILLLVWGVGALVGLSFPFASPEGGLSVGAIAITLIGLLLLGWGVRDIFIDFFE